MSNTTKRSVSSRRWTYGPSAVIVAAILAGCSSSQNDSSPRIDSERRSTRGGSGSRSGDSGGGRTDSAETTAAAAAETLPSSADDTFQQAAPADQAAPSAEERSKASRRAERQPPATYSPTTRGGTSSGESDWFAEPPAPENPDVNSRDAGVNPTEEARFDPLSTFALDVDTSSYTISRALVEQGQLPDYSTVRTEEFVNYFDQDYRGPSDGQTFAIRVDGTAAPFLASNQRIVRVGIQAERIDAADRAPAHLTFVIDTSGSMEEDGKLELVKRSLVTMVNNLRDDDEIAIVSFSDSAEIILGPTPAKQRDTIIGAIDRLTPTDSTNAEAGLVLGYDIADQMRDRDRSKKDRPEIHRVVLASDGVANVGPNGPEAILERIKDETTKGIDLVTVGVGTTSYNDEMMERLADGGDGFSAYIDSDDEATRLFRDQLVSTLQTVARDAKVQVEFDSRTVASYRLLGFENRDVADSDFRNDSVDAGEIGAGHSATALYEVTYKDDRDTDRVIGTVKLRWDDVRESKVKETSVKMDSRDFADSLGDANPRLGLDVTVAAYAEVLREGPWAKITTLDEIARQSTYLERELGNDPDVLEFVRLVTRASEFR